MIDLHCHTVFSDGDKTPDEILRKAEKLKLNFLSITDHNNCFAYENIKNNCFSGKLINGVEIVTSFDKQIIEILGYGMKTCAINQWARENDSNKKAYAYEIYNKLANVFAKNGILYTKNPNLDNIIKEEDPTGDIKLYIYNDLLKYPENKEIIEKRVLNSYSNFNKNGLNNPNSILFINEYERFPLITDVVDLIHKNGGLCFLAHIYQYNVENHIEFLHKLLDTVQLDGIETYHSSFSKNQIIEINKIADELNLYKSGGSDYHGKLKPNIKLGLDLQIPDELIKPWVRKID